MRNVNSTAAAVRALSRRLVALCAMVLLIVAAPPRALAAFEFSIAESNIQLDAPVQAVYPGGPETFITLRDNGVMALRSLEDGAVLSSIRVTGTPIAMSEAMTPQDVRELAFVVEEEPGKARSLIFVSATDTQMWIGRADQPDGAALPRIPLDRFANPAVRHIFEQTRGGRDIGGLVIWDRADEPRTASYFLLRNNELTEAKSAFYPTELMGVGTGTQLMALHGFAGEASFFNVVQGAVSSNVFDDALVVLEGREDGTDLVSFVPAAPFGGTGQAVVANVNRGTLTILEAVPSSRAPRHARPVTVTLPREVNALENTSDLMLVGDQQLERIYVGLRGPAAMDVIWGYSRLKGGLEPLTPTTLPGKIRDMRWVDADASPNRGYFILLGEDGRSVSIVHDIETAFAEQLVLEAADIRSAAIELQPTTATRGSEVLAVQRGLASLGYNVGVLDGISGAQTESAIRAFQLDNGLSVTGQVDERTATTLDRTVKSAGLGRWHTLIATHTLDARGCSFAQEDVPEVAKLLAGRAPTGTEVYIVRTNDPFYVVAISTGEDRELAQKLSTVVREVSPGTADGKTGADSFITTNKGWSVDEACNAWARVE